MKLNLFPITLIDAYMISPKVKHFVFEAALEPAFNFVPGQFITIHFERDGKMLKRSYSIANQPKQDNRIEFAAGYVEHGPGTDLLFNLKPGDTININGPFGRLTFKDEVPLRYILVATSTGVTPYRAMLEDIKKRLDAHPKLEVVILQGVQKHEDLLYGDAFMDACASHPRITFMPCFSRESQDTLLKHERLGYVQHCFDELNPNPKQDVFYLCGNPGMIDEAFSHLQAKGFEMKQIIREKYISN